MSHHWHQNQSEHQAGCDVAGVSLAMLAHAYGCRCHIAMPDDAAEEKGRMLEALGTPTISHHSRFTPAVCSTSCRLD